MEYLSQNSKGFIQTSILIAIVIGLVVIGGIGYFGVRSYQKEQIAKSAQDDVIQESNNATNTTEVVGIIDGSEIETLRKEIEELKKQRSFPTQVQTQELVSSSEIEELRKEIEKIKEQSFSTQTQETDPSAITLNGKIALSNAEIIKKVGSTVVFIETDNSKGTGMLIDPTGFILTNAHVVAGTFTAKIKLSDNRTFIALVIGRNEKVDLAILQIDGNNFPKVELGNSDEMAQGDEVFTLGYPFGIEGDVSFKEGTISRRIDNGEFVFFETSAEIHPGNSGGPLVNQYGQVIGINTAVFGESIKGVVIGETIKFAIPINFVKIYIPELKDGSMVLLPTDSKKIEYEEFQKFKNEYLMIVADAFSSYDLEKEAISNWGSGNHYIAIQKTEQAIGILDVAMKKLGIIIAPQLPFTNIIEELIQLQLDIFSLDKERNGAEKLRYDFFLDSNDSEFRKLEIWLNWEAAKDVEDYIKELQLERGQYSDQLSEKTKQYAKNADEYFK